MGCRFRINRSRNLNLLLFFILFHLQISGNIPLHRIHVAVLIDNRSNILASNNRLIIATFNEIERHSRWNYFNRCFGTRLIFGTNDRKHNKVRFTATTTQL